MPTLLTIQQAAEALQVSEMFIRTAIKDGRLPHIRAGREYRINSDDLAKGIPPKSDPLEAPDDKPPAA